MKMFRENLQKFMRLLGLNQVELSKKSGVNQAMISRYLRGDPKGKLPTWENLYRLSKALGITMAELSGDPGLDGIEEKAQKIAERDITDEERRLLDAYFELPEDDWRRQAVNEILLAKSKGRKK